MHAEEIDVAQQAALDDADLQQRLACLRIVQRRYEDAEEALREAERVFLAADDRFNLARVWRTRAALLLRQEKGPAAITWLLRALPEFAKHPVHQSAAIHNLLCALILNEPSPEGLEAILRHLQELRLSPSSRRPSRRTANRQPRGHRRRTLPDALARLAQGRIHVALGRHEDARTLLESSKDDFLIFHQPLYVVITNFDLAECILWSGRRNKWSLIVELAAECLQLLAAYPDMPETRKALDLWRLAAEQQRLQAVLEGLRRCRSSVMSRG